MSDVSVTPQLVAEHGLTPEEYEQLIEQLGREPNLTELGIFSVMWSEHCSYKSSRVHLRTLPTTGPQVIEGPGENAGVVDIGGGMAAVFKIESHNHPSFIEPHQGAATGVGGILRDVFTMGARPVALMNSLHFGPLDEPRNQHIMEGVVAGIAGYGNCVGVPTIGGEVHFHPSYSANPLVNAFCLGVAPAGKIFRARAAGDGNPVIYVGARTGRDGIHGATMASEEFSDDSEAKRPTVQVGDPFLEKLLLEACLEAMRSGAVVGIQDMGAAGLTCSTCEMGAKEGKGIEIDLTRVPQREAAMTPYETMLSESQERMLLVAERGREDEVLEIFARWDLDAVVIGQVRPEPDLVVRRGDEEIARIPNAALTDAAPLYQRPTRRSEALDRIPRWTEVERPDFETFDEPLRRLLASPHLASREWVYRQYDHMVRTNTVVLPGSDAAVIRVRETGGGLAMALDSNARFAALDPRQAAQLVVAEGCRNLAATGARPLAATNCLNFASPENPEVMWQFAETVAGLRTACEAFGTPITGGNVSFYNETRGAGVLPTPVLGIIGRIDDLDLICRSGFENDGDLIYLLGSTEATLGGSLYLDVVAGTLAGPCPVLDIESEMRLQEALLALIEARLIASAHDVSEGGLLCALAECCLLAGRGARCEIEYDEDEGPLDAQLFGEGPSRVVVSVPPDDEERFLRVASGVGAQRLGEVGGAALRLSAGDRPLVAGDIEDLRALWEGSLSSTFRH